VRVQVSYTDLRGAAEVVNSAATTAIANTNDAPTGAPTISGTPTEGQLLTADPSGIADADGLGAGAFSYQWQQSADSGTTWTNITGATLATFTPNDAQVGGLVRVRVNYTDNRGQTESVTSLATTAIVNVNDLPTGTLTITGAPTEGQVLTADTSTVADEDGLGPFSYQWQQSADSGTTWTNIATATQATFTPNDAQVNQLVRVQVSYTDLRGAAEVVTSGATAAIANTNDPPVGVPTIAGTPTEGQTLTADPSGITDEDGLGPFTYQWQQSLDGTTWSNIGGATQATFTPDDPHVGQQIRVRVVYLDGRGTVQTVFSTATTAITNVNDLPGGTVSITGTPTEGQVLTANTGSITDADGLGPFTYQWQQSTNGTTWNDIATATQATFTPDDAQVGQQVRVQVFYTDNRGTNETVTSTGTTAIGNVNDLPIGTPTVTGTPTEGQVLTADTSGITDADGLGPFSYEWQQFNGTTWTAISGANQSTFTPDDAQVGRTLRVRVLYTDLRGANEVTVSAPTAAIANINDAPAGTVTITGTATEESPLAVNTAGLTDADGLGPFSYQWQQSADNGTTWTNIIEATADTFTPDDAQVGQLVRVQVSYTDGRGTAETVNSTPTAAIISINDDPTGTVTITGTATEESALTVDTTGLADADDLGTFSYQWQQSADNGTTWTNITGETANTFTPDDAQVGQQVRVQVSYTDGQGTAETVNSTPTAAVTSVNDAPTGLPTITGTPTEDQVLTVGTGGIADADGLSTFSYQWQQSADNGTTWTNITGATNATFIPGDTQVDQLVRVQVFYTDGQGTAETVNSAPTTAIANINDAPTGVPTLTGTPTEGQVLTVGTGGIADADGLDTFSYQWQQSADNGTTWTNITGETATTFTPDDAQVNQLVRVQVSYTDGQGTAETVSSAATTPIANVNDLPTGLPAITGTPTEGELLTADPSAIADADGLGTFSYQWQQSTNGVIWNDITGATQSTFTPVDAQVTQRVRVRVSYTDARGTAEVVNSNPTTAIANVNDLPTGLPTITGTPTEGEVLTAETGGIADADGLGTFSYQWQQSADNGITWTDITGATQTTFTPDDAQVTQRVRVQVSYTDGQGTAETVNSDPTTAIANVNDLPTGLPTITGTAAEGTVLTAETGAITDADGLGAFSYQWQQSSDGTTWNNIVGATNTTFTPDDPQVGQQIRVQVSYTDARGANEVVTSTATTNVTNVNDLPTGLPTITGTATEGQVLSVETAGIADADGLGTFSYQWQQSTNGTDWNSITGATSTTFTPDDAQVGQQIRVQVFYTDARGTAETVASNATAAITNVNDLPTGTATITGTTAEGQALTVNTAALADADGLGTFSYQWQQSINGMDWSAITGATSDTFTPDDAQVGQQLRVQITYTDARGTDETVNSAPSAPITNVNDLPTGTVTVTGTPTEGQVLSVDTTGLVDADGLGTFSYQWQQSSDGTTWNTITGATQSTFTPNDPQVTQQVRVQITYTDGQGTAETVNSTATGAIANVNDLPTGTVTITGTVTEGQILTVNTSALADADGLGTLNYQWEESLDGTTWTAITGATATTFTPDDAQVGSQLRVQITYTDARGTDETVTSTASLPIVNANDLPTGTVVITGTPTEGEVLGVDTTGLNDPDGLGTFSYQWQQSANGTDWSNIDAAIGATFTLDDPQVGQQVRVRVFYTDGQGTAEVVNSGAIAAITGVNDAPTGLLTITGTPVTGQALTASATQVIDAEGVGAIAYQWQQSDDGVTWTDIQDATTDTFTPGAAQLGQQLRVTGTYTDGQGTVEQVQSAATVTVTNPPGFTITPVTLSLSEAGETATFTIVLDAQPTADVTLPLSVNGDRINLDLAQLTFTTTNWDQPQTVTVTGLDNDVDDGDQAATIITGDPSSADTRYNGASINPDDISITVTDDDTVGFTLSETLVSVSESGTTASFTVVLTSQPATNVVLQVASSNTSEATAAPATLTFTTTTWDTPQTVTITGIDDQVLDGDQTSTLTISVVANQSDDTFDGVSNQTVSVSTIDNDTLAATPGSDQLSGTTGDDVIDALGGNDTVWGVSGNDRIFGQTGNDTLFGENGNDTLLGGDGDDTVIGAAGRDRLEGHAGNDRLEGGDGNDTCFGGTGDDLMLGGIGNDRLEGNDGNDAIFGGDGDDRLLGGRGQDTLNGGSGNDTLLGQADDDLLLGGSGNDLLNGNRGNDVIVTGTGRDRIVINNRQGFDRVRDFADGLDRIVLGGNLSFERLTLKQRQGGVLISLDSRQLLFLNNMNLGQITSADFV